MDLIDESGGGDLNSLSHETFAAIFDDTNIHFADLIEGYDNPDNLVDFESTTNNEIEIDIDYDNESDDDYHVTIAVHH